MNRVTTVADLRRILSELYPDLTTEQIHNVATVLWVDDANFPHPVNNTDITEYLAGLGDDFIYETAGVA